MATTTTTILAPPVQQYFSRKLLAVPTPKLIHTVPSMKKTMPANGGTKLRQRRYNRLSTNVVPLGNSGVTPAGQELSAIDIDAEIQSYGDYLTINEQVTLSNQDPVLNEAAIRLGVAMRETEDELTREMLSSTASFINCTGGVNGDQPTEITRTDVDEIIRLLEDNDARSLTDVIEGEDKFGTAPVRNGYFALGSTKLIGDLEQVAGFTHVANYPSQNKIHRSEWGSIANLRFLLSSEGKIRKNASTLGSDIREIFCVGMEAYSCIDQDRAGPEFIYRDAMYSGPLAQNITVGWKMRYASVITNDAWVLKLNATSSV